MEIKLQSLNLMHFKGTKSFQLNCNGNDIEIHGDNETGKTTIFDAFLWLLFDKDSEGKKDFDIKTLNKFNEPIHKLDHTVEAVLNIDGTETIFKKTYKENWVKKRGNPEATLEGHTTDYWINDVPTKKKDYDKYINDIIDETTFKLLTDIRYFTEKINWKERRDILTDIAAVHMDPVELPRSIAQLIGNKSLDDFKKIISEKKKKLKEEIKAIPIRIDELTLTIPSVQDINFDVVKSDISMYEKQLDELNNDGKQIAEHNNKLFDLKSILRQKESLLKELEQDITKETNREYEQALKDKSTVEYEITQYERQLRNLEIKEAKIDIEEMGKRLNKLREKWTDENNKQYDGTNICPTCGQEFPESYIEELEDRFKKSKQITLDDINHQGIELKQRKEDLQNHIIDLLNTEKELNLKLGDSRYKLNEFQKIINKGISTPNFTTNAAWQAIESEINKLNTQILDFKEVSDSDLEIKKSECRSRIRELQMTLSKQTQYDLAQDRLNELKQEERTLNNNLNELEAQEYEIDEYNRKKIDSLESTVNDMFQNIKIKMFEAQVNGGTNETCDILIDGVPYSSANYAGRINAGLDIISTLSKEYDIKVPVFVDNSESVTKLLQLDQQMIKLIVDPKYKKLAVIENMKEAM